MILNLLAVFIGGGLGAVLRYLVGTFSYRYLSLQLPVATFTVNVVSCFIIGLALSFFLYKTDLNMAWKLALTVGFCGGLSTFSSFSVEVLELFRVGNYVSAVGYIFASVLICLLSTFIGFKLGGKFFC